MHRLAIVIEVLAPYFIPRYKALRENREIDFEVIALQSANPLREWVLPTHSLPFKYSALINSEEPTPKASTLLLDHLRSANPDVILMSGYHQPPFRKALSWATSNDTPVILSSDTTRNDRRRVWPKELIKKRLVSKASAAFVAGELSSEYIQSLGIPATHIWKLQNVVDNEFFATARTHLHSKADDIRQALTLPRNYFLYVGRFSEEKNLTFLLESYLHYKTSGRGTWGLVMVGSGPEDALLRKFAEANALSDIVWAGFRQINELPHYYSFAGCLILPSLSEAWGLVVNEAMASSLPALVSNRCGCVPELIIPGLTGYTFDPTRRNELLELMVYISSPDSNLPSMGHHCAELIRHFSPRNWADSLADCVRRVAFSPKCQGSE